MGDTDKKNRLVDTGGEGEGGINWESSMETYIAICKIRESGNLPYDAGSLNLVLCDNLEEWDGVGGVKGIQEGGEIYIYIHLWLIYVYIWQKPTQYCKAIILQLKKK